MKEKNLYFELKDKCKYDQISLGEVMLRLDPGEGRIRSSRNFKVCEGGGEYNVARTLSKCFKKKTGIITALAENDVGMLLEDCMMQGGVDTSLIKWCPYDGIGKQYRNGLNFTERGFGIRAAVGVSDRANTAISKMETEDFNFEYVFGELGTRWFHTGGIFVALSEETEKVAYDAIKVAKKYGTIVSYDLNYRSSLWSKNGGIKNAQRINSNMVKNVDVLIGNEEDFCVCLGIENEIINEELDEKRYEKLINRVVKKFPNLKVIATSLRDVKTATVNNWMGLLWVNGKIYKSRTYKHLEILDRVGGGDAFSAGIIYSLMLGKEEQKIIDFATASGAMAMTTPGDTSMATVSEIDNIVNGVTPRIKR